MRDTKKKGSKQLGQRELRPTVDLPIPAKGPGSQIGLFRIERQLGRGGMGIAYLAHDTTLDRPVAIKSLPPEVKSDRQIRPHFKYEAKVFGVK